MIEERHKNFNSIKISISKALSFCAFPRALIMLSSFAATQFNSLRKIAFVWINLKSFPQVLCDKLSSVTNVRLNYISRTCIKWWDALRSFRSFSRFWSTSCKLLSFKGSNFSSLFTPTENIPLPRANLITSSPLCRTLIYYATEEQFFTFYLFNTTWLSVAAEIVEIYVLYLALAEDKNLPQKNYSTSRFNDTL